jgi:hypothetical protein
MLVGLGGVFFVSMISLFNTDKKPFAMLNLGIFSWLLLLLITIKFFPWGGIVLIFSILISLYLLMTMIKQQQFTKLIPLGLCASIAIFFFMMQTDTRYYLLNIKWNYEISDDFITLDKYSWFLYKNGNNEEALKVSIQALEIAKKAGQEEWIKLIDVHNQLIRTNEWKNYR